MTDILPFPPRRPHKASPIDLTSYVEQINTLTEDLQRYEQFIQSEADRFCIEVENNASLAASRAQTLLGYMHEMQRKSELIQEISKTMERVHNFNLSPTQP